ncbi:GntR family transcriptional regulator [Brochothrix campestris]|uniref:Crp/Fnr family transcriptional regulator n=1 Tax=Brochothrix campestris FSL F6-1037 TaxID=1265861 RepID=W7D2E5_9LIST|nr:LacI family DNA-binding transcriptional regulator [Brochothrix campestris]EUJ42096.1 Crp/Fnr family transcriptional regulator [Brochothrix campestris FSL F6-1037]
MKEPLYQHIIMDLKQAIIAGTYPPGSKLPTELNLSETYGVSRITSKRALVELENEGIVIRVRGKGSFVREKAVVSQSKTIKKDVLFILPFPDNTTVGNYAQGMFEVIQATHYRLQMQPHQYLSNLDVKDIVERYAGVIFYPRNNHDDIELLYRLHLFGVPTVLIDKKIDQLPFSSVMANNEQGAYEATRHLIAQKHQKIAFINIDAIGKKSSVRDRYFGYLKALHGYELEPYHFEQLDPNDSQFLMTLCTELQRLNITAIIAENDVLAIQLINALKKQNVSIPKDIAVIGFDNIQAAQLIEPHLTTVAQNFEEMGSAAMRLLLAELDETSIEHDQVVVPIQLIERASTRNLKEEDDVTND